VTRLGTALLALVAGLTVFAPALTLHGPSLTHRDHVLAPPMPVRLHDAAGEWSWPVVYPVRLTDRLARTYAEDRSRPVPVAQALGAAAAAAGTPWFPLGTDSLGRDVWSRLVNGARLSLALSLVATTGALLLGLLAGGIAGYAGGRTDTLLMRLCELVMVVPALYVVLALRAALPLVLPAAALFTAMVALLAVVGTPQVARSVRAVVLGERGRDYVEAARAAGSGHARILARHLLPAAREVVVAQGLLLLPAFIVAESTLSFIGLGFDPATPSWGTMLQEAANVRAIAEYPWVLAPAGAIALTVLGFNLLADGRDRSRLHW
jgi:peptide/nickel transport system permease protein